MEEGIFIGQAAEILKCNKSYLRFYESEFQLEIPRNASNRRVYYPTELEKFRYIDKLKNDGYSNTQIKAVLNSQRINHSSYNKQAYDEQPLNAELLNSSSPEDSSSIYALIEKLREEIKDIKEIGGYKEKNELQKENEMLKAKLKEKTYELVEARERLSNIKQVNRRKFFKI